MDNLIIFTISTNGNIICQRDWKIIDKPPTDEDYSKIVTLLKLYLKTHFHKKCQNFHKQAYRDKNYPKMSLVISFRVKDEYIEYYIDFDNMVRKIKVTHLFNDVKKILKVK